MHYLPYSQYLSLPDFEGVYEFYNNSKDLIYVGKAKNLKNRVSSYFNKTIDQGEKTRLLVSEIRFIKYTVVANELEALLLEAYFIKKYKPRYNIKLTDDKSFPLIEITKMDKYPALLYTRQIKSKDSEYFGPYPDALSTRRVLKILRRAFLLKNTRNHPKRICLYNHIQLCMCPEYFDSTETQKVYRQNVSSAIKILEGKSQILIKDLIKKRDSFSKNENFEEASKLNKQIKALSIITKTYTQNPFDYAVNPNLIDDITKNQLDSLTRDLRLSGVNISDLDRIECYDISNISGTNPTGSMVVFTKGRKDSSEYKRFKIRDLNTPNDFAMLTQMLERRLMHTDWDKPSLIIIDGGKPQVSTALKVLEKLNLNYPLVGLAKKQETIIIPYYDNLTLKFKSLSLDSKNPGLLLVTKIRDEAHRFAVTYHKKLRSKNLTN